MADSVQTYLRNLEEEYERPFRVRNLMPVRVSAGLQVTIGLAAGQGNPVNAGPINFTVVFSSPVTGFVNADISFTGSTVGGTPAAVVSGGPSTYNVAVTGMTGNGLVAVSIPAGAATSTATGTLSPASNTAFVTLDTAAPSVTINQAAGQSDPAGLAPILFTVVFSEAVTGFINTGVAITGTAGGTKVVALSGGPATYTASVTGMTTAGTVIANIAASVCTDLAGNANTISTSTDNTVTWQPDVTAPTVTINKGAGQADPTSASPILFDVVFSEIVTGFTAANISFTGSTTGGGALVAVISGSGPTYTVSVTGMTGDGNVVASIPATSVTDLAGNPNTASTSTDNIVAWTAPVGGTDGQMDFSLATQSGLFVLLDDF